jgi:hypothetical protein
MPAKLRLHCDILNCKFTLSQQGEEWIRPFASFDEAYEEAEKRVADTPPLILYNEQGRVIMETVVYPAPDVLVKFRHPLGGGLAQRRNASRPATSTMDSTLNP